MLLGGGRVKRRARRRGRGDGERRTAAHLMSGSTHTSRCDGHPGAQERAQGRQHARRAKSGGDRACRRQRRGDAEQSARVLLRRRTRHREARRMRPSSTLDRGDLRANGLVKSRSRGAEEGRRQRKIPARPHHASRSRLAIYIKRTQKCCSAAGGWGDALGGAGQRRGRRGDGAASNGTASVLSEHRCRGDGPQLKPPIDDTAWTRRRCRCAAATLFGEELVARADSATTPSSARKCPLEHRSTTPRADCSRASPATDADTGYAKGGG